MTPKVNVTQWSTQNPGRRTWSAATIAPQRAASSPANVGAALNNQNIAAAGNAANEFNTATPEVQQQMSAASPTGTPLQAGSSAIGWLNWISQNPVTADQLLIPKSGVNDPKLATFDSSNSPLRGLRRTDAQVSLFNNPNAPREILNQINSLNLNQSLRRASQAEYIDRLYQAAPENPVYAEALRAASIQPGSAAAFGERIQSSGEMQANEIKNTGIGAAAQGAAALQQQQAATVAAAGAAERKLEQLRAKRAQIGPNPMGFYTGSEQEKLDKQIFALQDQVDANSATQQRAIAAAGVTPSSFSGTTPATSVKTYVPPSQSGWVSSGLAAPNYNIW